jgi:dUTP pyrophosphatase
MFDNIKNLRESVKMMKELQGKFNGIDMSNPEQMLASLGVNEDQLNSYFEDSLTKKVELKYTNQSDNKGPEYAYESDSGFDLRSSEDVIVKSFGRCLVPTGMSFDIPDGYEIQVRSKSGLALNQGLMVLNSPGTVDSGYQGEVKVIIFNTSNEEIKIEKGQKIAQAVLCPVVNGKWVNLINVSEINKKDRNDNGFGSTGLK